MNKCLASWFCGAIKVSTKLFKDILSDLFVMVIYPVFKNSQDDDTKSAFVIETIDWWILAIVEVSVGAGGLEGFHF